MSGMPLDPPPSIGVQFALPESFRRTCGIACSSRRQVGPARQVQQRSARPERMQPAKPLLQLHACVVSFVHPSRCVIPVPGCVRRLGTSYSSPDPPYVTRGRRFTRTVSRRCPPPGLDNACSQCNRFERMNPTLYKSRKLGVFGAAAPGEMLAIPVRSSEDRSDWTVTSVSPTPGFQNRSKRSPSNTI